MAEEVAVVTDSTADLPHGRVEELGVTVVPLQVHVDGRSARDGVEIGPRELAEALRAKARVTTSRPAPAEFVHAYQACLDAGASRIVSVHLAAALSGTWESATLAAAEFGHGVVRVVDSRSTAMALGFAVLAAARAARDGAGAADVHYAAVATVDDTRTLFYVDTLEYLRRGGRIGTASALLATSLSVKPLLQIVDGQVIAVEKVRTPSKALARLVHLTAQAAGAGPVGLAVHHLDSAQRADHVAGELRSAIPQVRELYVAELGAVVGAHLGPGVVGTVVVRR
jgi:DegV family protein with EDD domain